MRASTKFLLGLLFSVTVVAFLMGKIPGSPFPPMNLPVSFPGQTAASTLEPSYDPEATITENIEAIREIKEKTETKEQTQPTPGFEEAPSPLGTPEPLGVTSPDFLFLSVNPDTSPVTFSPCRPIHYVVRETNAPEGGDVYITEAIETISKYTGLQFIFDGTTDESPSIERKAYQPDKYGDRWAPVLIAWADDKEKNKNSFTKDQIGEARTYKLTRANGVSHYVTGQVVLDVNSLLRLQQEASPEVITAVIKHEFGHLVGLGHTSAESELMFATTRDKVTSFGLGDLTGLSKLGKGTCAPDL